MNVKDLPGCVSCETEDCPVRLFYRAEGRWVKLRLCSAECLAKVANAALGVKDMP